MGEGREIAAAKQREKQRQRRRTRRRRQVRRCSFSLIILLNKLLFAMPTVSWVLLFVVGKEIPPPIFSPFCFSVPQIAMFGEAGVPPALEGEDDEDDGRDAFDRAIGCAPGDGNSLVSDGQSLSSVPPVEPGPQGGYFGHRPAGHLGGGGGDGAGGDGGGADGEGAGGFATALADGGVGSALLGADGGDSRPAYLNDNLASHVIDMRGGGGGVDNVGGGDDENGGGGSGGGGGGDGGGEKKELGSFDAFGMGVALHDVAEIETGQKLQGVYSAPVAERRERKPLRKNAAEAAYENPNYAPNKHRVRAVTNPSSFQFSLARALHGSQDVRAQHQHAPS